MIRVNLSSLEKYLLEIFGKNGLNADNAKIVADVFMRATLRGVGHHDIYDIESRIKGLKAGKIVPNPEYTPVSSFGAMESWDAGNGLGEVVCTFAMDRAMALAEKHGMGMCALRNTNHYLAAAPYVERAAEKGYIAMLLCKANVSMGAPGVKELCMSQLPMGFAYGTDDDYPVMLDICMAYASFGQLKYKSEHGETVPDWWGYDEDGNSTTNPGAMAKGVRLPIGGHKGFGLAMLGEILTGVMSSGCVLGEKATPDGVANNSAHTAIAIKADALVDMDTFKKRAGALSSGAKELAPGVHIPGEGSYKAKKRYMEQGSIELEDGITDLLNGYAKKFGIEQLGE